MKKYWVVLILLILFPLVISPLQAGEKEDFALAEEAYRKELFAETVSYLEKFIAHYPESKRADYCHLILGISYFKLKQREKAISQFQNILLSYPKSRYREMATYYLATALYEAGKYQQASERFQNFLEEYPNSEYGEFAHYALLLSALQLSNLSRAVAWLQALEKFHPQSNLIKSGKKVIAYRYYQDALSYYEKRNYSSALNNFQKAISFTREKSLLANSFLKIGDIFFNQKRYKEAEDSYGKVISDFPDSSAAPFGLFQLGILYKKQGDLKKARAIFAKLPITFPKSALIPDSIYEIGLTFFREEDYPRARESFENIIKNYSASESAKSALLQKALSYYNEKEYQKALSTFREFIDEYPKHHLIGEVCYGAGNTLTQLGRKKEAREIWIKGARVEPASPLAPDINLLVARSYFEEEKFDKAKFWLKEILERFPKSSVVPETLYLLGLSSLKGRGGEEAMEYFDRFLAIYPISPLSPYVLREKGNLLMNQKKWQKAIDIFKKIPKENRFLYAETLFKIGECFQNLKQPKDALHYYLQITAFYKDISPWNKRADKAIAELKKKHK